MYDAAFAPDSLIFDIDGVLINVERSFPEMVRLSILHLWETLCKGISDGTAYTPAHDRVLKLDGAFNDDYDIIWTMLSMSLSTGEKKITDAFPTPEKLENELETLSGGLHKWVKERYTDSVPQDRIREYAASLYTGGLYKDETLMVRRHWRDMPLPTAIYSGRNRVEWELAKESLGWQDFPDELVIHADSGILKPSPEGLEILSVRLKSERPAFFGDTASDSQAQEAFGRGYFVGVGKLMKDQKIYCDSPETVLAELDKRRDGGKKTD